MYTMKKTAELTGLSEHTLRYYDKEGLLPGLARDGVGRRVFSDEICLISARYGRCAKWASR